MAQGKGDVSSPLVGVHHDLAFTEHPPFWILVHSLWYRLFGTGPISTNAFPVTVLLFSAVMVGVAAMRVTGDSRAFFWVMINFALNPTVSKWRHEPLLDWGLVVSRAIVIAVMAFSGTKRRFVSGLLVGLTVGVALLSKGLFGSFFLVVGLYYVFCTEHKSRALAGLACALAGVLVAWLSIDGSEWNITKSVFEHNVAPYVGGSPWPHVLPVLRAFFLQNAPWSFLVVAGTGVAWRKHTVSRACLILVLVTTAGFAVAGRHTSLSMRL